MACQGRNVFYRSGFGTDLGFKGAVPPGNAVSNRRKADREPVEAEIEAGSASRSAQEIFSSCKLAVPDDLDGLCARPP